MSVQPGSCQYCLKKETKINKALISHHIWTVEGKAMNGKYTTSENLVDTGSVFCISVFVWEKKQRILSNFVIARCNHKKIKVSLCIFEQILLCDYTDRLTVCCIIIRSMFASSHSLSVSVHRWLKSSGIFKCMFLLVHWQWHHPGWKNCLLHIYLLFPDGCLQGQRDSLPQKDNNSSLSRT